MVSALLISIALLGVTPKPTPAMVAGTPAMVADPLPPKPIKPVKPVKPQEPPQEPVVCEYWSATWCTPCQTFAPIVNKLIQEGKPIVKSDCDEKSDRANLLEVTRVPTLLLWQGDKVIKRHINTMTEEQLRAWLTDIPKATEPTVPLPVPPVPASDPVADSTPPAAPVEPLPTPPVTPTLPAAQPAEVMQFQVVPWGRRWFGGKMQRQYVMPQATCGPNGCSR